MSRIDLLGGDVTADERQGRCGVSRGAGICTDGCPVADHMRGARGQTDSSRCSPPSNLCLGNQKHMAPHNGSTVVLSVRAGRTHTSTQPVMFK